MFQSSVKGRRGRWEEVKVMNRCERFQNWKAEEMGPGSIHKDSAAKLPNLLKNISDWRRVKKEKFTPRYSSETADHQDISKRQGKKDYPQEYWLANHLQRAKRS